MYATTIKKGWYLNIPMQIDVDETASSPSSHLQTHLAPGPIIVDTRGKRKQFFTTETLFPKTSAINRTVRHTARFLL